MKTMKDKAVELARVTQQRDKLLDALENLLAWDETDLEAGLLHKDACTFLPGNKARDIVAALAATDDAKGVHHNADIVERYANNVWSNSSTA